MTFSSRNSIRLTLLFLILLYFLSCLSIAAAAENKVIFNQLDGVGDDYGPGKYQYPRNHIFQNKGHLFDIKSLTILESADNFLFQINFSKLTDPWQGEFAFSLPLIEIYLDNQPGGTNKLFHTGANVTLPADFNWNKFLKISGWWVRIFSPDSQKENLMDISKLSFIDPYSAEDVNLIRNGNQLNLTIPKTELKSLDNSKLILLVGSFDPFGYDHFRSLAPVQRSWQIYTGGELKVEKAPRVMDILLPESLNQKAILNKEMPVVPYLKIKPTFQLKADKLIDFFAYQNLLVLFLLLIYLILMTIIFLKYSSK
ncbi:C-terminal binding-module, SLH-like, of glucodextranase [Halanaerobium salsuginis]|jgi:carbohydrate-binding DOMON domain-containing protein|uniref:C-terminal binding-module, SLH-like, of glucodextranase n=1 Tax=Halanaerobium salsuginis TaxID=29563 RepID=A0A1I4J0V2_9FIRM|nr:C-terminal binding-module, SLH-like, of glucodextranase [Halanaerobium salsuginis]